MVSLKCTLERRRPCWELRRRPPGRGGLSIEGGRCCEGEVVKGDMSPEGETSPLISWRARTGLFGLRVVWDCGERVLLGVVLWWLVDGGVD